MARYDLDSVVTQSLLDRLIDREPREQAEATMTRAQSVRALRASVRRDLEWLLNTRRIPEEAGAEYPEASRSLFNYGLPDFSSFSFSNPKDRLRLLRSIESVVEIFEPRLEAIRVVLIERDAADFDRSIRFQIEGLLKMDPAPEQITFDTMLSLTSGEYQIKGDRG
jgi:type VI secretion system protein ImpF